MVRPRKEPTVRARLKKSDNVWVLNEAHSRGMSLSDFMHEIIETMKKGSVQT
jgi:hypothetical protein